MNFSFNKEETEEIMEKLMNRIVAKPNLIADDRLNAKIEKMFDDRRVEERPVIRIACENRIVEDQERGSFMDGPREEKRKAETVQL